MASNFITGIHPKCMLQIFILAIKSAHATKKDIVKEVKP